MKERREDIEEQVIKSIFEYVRKIAEPPSLVTVVRRKTLNDGQTEAPSNESHFSDPSIAAAQWLYDLEQDAINAR